MLFKDALKTATKALTHGKMRSVLTMLGIVIGIASVIILMSIGQSAQSLIIGQVEGIGSNLIFIVPGGTGGGDFAAPPSSQGIVITTLQQKDIDALLRDPSITNAVPESRGQAEIIFGNKNITVSYEGTSEDFFQVLNMPVGRGNAFTKGDVQSLNHVLVIGPDLAKNLFGELNPIGKTVRLKNTSFQVIGVLEKGGTGAFGVDQGNLAVMPISVAQKKLLGVNYFTDVVVKVNDAYDVSFAKSRVAFTLRQSHGITDPDKDDFTIRTQEDALAILGTITSILTLFLAAIASISLIVGGIGIMNIMLVAVTERTREIGLRKAVGATDGDILQQFLIESIILTVTGGIIGIVGGATVIGAIYLVISKFFLPEWVFSMPISSVLLAIGVSSAAGLIFGIYPARKAGKKNPIDALRYE